MDETGLEKINNKIDENDKTIKCLLKLLKKAGSPKTEIQAVLDWLYERQATLERRYTNKVNELCEIADIISNEYNTEVPNDEAY